jgi:hypothetical protein
MENLRNNIGEISNLRESGEIKIQTNRNAQQKTTQTNQMRKNVNVAVSQVIQYSATLGVKILTPIFEQIWIIPVVKLNKDVLVILQYIKILWSRAC